VRIGIIGDDRAVGMAADLTAALHPMSRALQAIARAIRGSVAPIHEAHRM
jgi:hypothetical protein